MSVLYGMPPIEEADSPYIHKANDYAARISEAAMPGAYLVEFFTWMNYLPAWMAKWKRDAINAYKKDYAFIEGLYEEAKSREVIISCHCSSTHT